jgi:regulatory protein
MGIITELRQGKRSKKHMNVFIDGRFALALKTETVIKNRLKVGGELTEEQVTELVGQDMAERGMDTAVRYLGYRPRSEAEIREKLQRRGFTEEVTDTVINKLKEQGLLDDTAFAHFWKENRESFSPRSSWLTRQELKRKGVADEVVERVVKTVDDEANAYQAAQSKVRRLPAVEYGIFRQRLGEYLKRRGFGYGVINQTIAKIWQERETRNPA